MESIVPRKDAYERLHRRGHSQASAAASTTPTTMSGKSTSTSSHPRATIPSYALHTHRYHHSDCDRITLGVRQPLRLPLGSSRESSQTMTPISSLLQEKLQQERKAESERLAAKFGTDMGSPIGDIRDGDGLGSSGRFRPVTEQRPTSSSADDSSQSSMGAKQIEKAVSTLHKQNFDLKLELFHRREKQSSLEARVEELEAERQEWQSSRDTLLAEMAKKDKAIEEAVNMIVKLEASLDSLIQEKEMMGHVDTDGSSQPSWHVMADSLRDGAPKQGDNGDLLSVDPKNTLERMPSFLSERSIHTENLRNIVLQNRSSLMRLRKISQVSSSSADVSEINRVANSPSLSILSESSFVSIYGSKQDEDGLGLLPFEDNISGIDGTSIDRSSTPTKTATANSHSNQATIISSYMAGMTPKTVNNHSDQVIPLNSAVHHNASLSRTDEFGEQVSTTESGTSEAFKSSREKGVITPTPPAHRSPSRWDKREGASTMYPTHNELVNVHGLPPTPDTVSSSVLRKHKGSPDSRDSFPRPDDARIPRFIAASPPPDIGCLKSMETHVRTHAPMTMPRHTNGSKSPIPNSKKSGETATSSDLDQLALSRAKTADTEWPRSDGFDSDSDSDGGADAHSDTESCDYWIRESYKPDNDSIRAGARRPDNSSDSPDLFSFPLGSGGWEPEAMFGALGGAGFLGTPVPSLKRDPMDEIGSFGQSFQPGLSKPVDGPQLPSRKSSLNRHNSQAAGYSSQTGRFGGGSSRDDDDVGVDGGERSNSVDGFGNTASFGIRHDTGTTTKRSQYPPISGLHSRGRGLGLNSLLRRSGSETYGPHLGVPESTFLASVLHNRASPTPQTQAQYAKRHAGRASVPPPASTPWVTRPVHPAEDNNASATPPPIRRNRPPPPLETDFAGPNAPTSETSSAVEADTRPASRAMVIEGPTLVSQMTPAAPQGGGGVRKWLGLGKRASLMNHTKS
ncbi:hypothetical protein F4861DRAFT_508278 [Xylaria intraflava]|nr:hypothetical protein F4861DRAFT_508278 [Xylaria intraflava]